MTSTWYFKDTLRKETQISPFLVFIRWLLSFIYFSYATKYLNWIFLMPLRKFRASHAWRRVTNNFCFYHHFLKLPYRNQQLNNSCIYRDDTNYFISFFVHRIWRFRFGALVRRRKSSSEQNTSSPQLHAADESNGRGGQHNLLRGFTGVACCDKTITLQWAHNPIWVWKLTPS